jgi:Fe-S-cluster containining protein
MTEKEYKQEFIECRPGCGACCIVISISSPIPGMPNGKPAGVRCIHLSDDGLCGLFGTPDRPPVCSQFQAEKAICGSSAKEAFRNIGELEGLDDDFINSCKL